MRPGKRSAKRRSTADSASGRTGRPSQVAGSSSAQSASGERSAEADGSAPHGAQASMAAPNSALPSTRFWKELSEIMLQPARVLHQQLSYQ